VHNERQLAYVCHENENGPGSNCAEHH
jgi:hypothetical protein